MTYKFCRLMGFASFIKGRCLRKCDEASQPNGMAGLSYHSYHVSHHRRTTYVLCFTVQRTRQKKHKKCLLEDDLSSRENDPPQLLMITYHKQPDISTLNK